VTNVNPLIGTLKLHSNSNTVIDRLAVDVDGWSVTFGTVKRGLSGLAPPRCTKYNSPPINGQCTNFILFDVTL